MIANLLHPLVSDIKQVSEIESLEERQGFQTCLGLSKIRAMPLSNIPRKNTALRPSREELKCHHWNLIEWPKLPIYL